MDLVTSCSAAKWLTILPTLPAGFVFAGMAVVSFLVILPASRVSDRLGRKWTIVPSAVAIAAALLLMAAAGRSIPSPLQY